MLFTQSNQYLKPISPAFLGWTIPPAIALKSRIAPGAARRACAVRPDARHSAYHGTIEIGAPSIVLGPDLEHIIPMSAPTATGGNGARKTAKLARDSTPMQNGTAPDAGKVRLLTRESLDGRTKAAQTFIRTASETSRGLGGEDHLSAIQKHLVEAFAGVAVHLGDLHTRLLLGEKIDICEHATAVSTMVRIAQRVGVKRIPRDVTSVREYLDHVETETVEEAAE